MSIRFCQTAYHRIPEVVVVIHNSGNLIFHQEADSWCFFLCTIGHYQHVLLINSTVVWMEVIERKTDVMRHSL